MVSVDYFVENLTPKTFAELAPLMEDAFGGTVGTNYFEWKYLHNPSGPAIGNIARAGQDGEVAAFYGMIPENCHWGNRSRRIYQSCDTMTHSRHRRRGLFRLLALETYQAARAADEDFFAFGFGGPKSTPGLLKMGWQIEFDLVNLFRPYPLTLLPIGMTGSNNIHRSNEPTDELIAMVRSSSADEIGSIEKTEAFVRWRLGNPLHTYEYLIEGQDAYAIYYREGRILFIFDFWERVPGSGKSIWNALRLASLVAPCKGVLTFAQPGTAFERRLKRYGFIRNPFKRGPGAGTIPFVTYGECPGGRGADHWSITPFDHDSY